MSISCKSTLLVTGRKFNDFLKFKCKLNYKYNHSSYLISFDKSIVLPLFSPNEYGLSKSMRVPSPVSEVTIFFSLVHDSLFWILLCCRIVPPLASPLWTKKVNSLPEAPLNDSNAVILTAVMDCKVRTKLQLSKYHRVNFPNFTNFLLQSSIQLIY